MVSATVLSRAGEQTPEPPVLGYRGHLLGHRFDKTIQSFGGTVQRRRAYLVRRGVIALQSSSLMLLHVVLPANVRTRTLEKPTVKVGEHYVSVV
jgi:hypothetical protein